MWCCSVNKWYHFGYAPVPPNGTKVLYIDLPSYLSTCTIRTVLVHLFCARYCSHMHVPVQGRHYMYGIVFCLPSPVRLQLNVLEKERIAASQEQPHRHTNVGLPSMKVSDFGSTQPQFMAKSMDFCTFASAHVLCVLCVQSMCFILKILVYSTWRRGPPVQYGDHSQPETPLGNQCKLLSGCFHACICTVLCVHAPVGNWHLLLRACVDVQYWVV